MANECNKTEYNHGEKSLKVPFIIYVDLECLLEIIRSCQNNLKKSYRGRKAKHEPSSWAMTVKCLFDLTKSKHDYYRERDCIKKLCKKLRDRAMAIINYKEKETIPLNDEENKSYEKQKVCHKSKKKFCNDENEKSEFELYDKVRDHCHYTGKFRGAAHSICNWNCKVPKEIPVVIHNATYDTQFIIKQLAEEFDGQFECLGENAENYITFSVPIKKEHDNGKTITHKLKLIASYRFMQSKLSDLVDNLLEIYKKECKACTNGKEIKSECDFNEFKNNRLNYKCKEYGKRCFKSINGSINNFPILHQFCNGDLNKFVLLLRKSVYPYEYMDSWERFNEESLPDKEAFNSKLNEEGITDKDYVQAQKVWKVFQINNFGEYHDLYVQTANVFENFRDKCVEIFGLDPAHFLSAPGLAWQACLKKAGVKLELFTDTDVLLMVEKGIRGGICQAIYRYVKANNKYMKSHDKSIISSYLMCLNANNLYRWIMSQKLPVNSFKWVKNLSKFIEPFIKNYDENSIMLSFQKICLAFIVILHFYLKGRKSENIISLFATYKTKKNMLFT